MDRKIKLSCAFLFLARMTSEAWAECPISEVRVEAECAEALASDVAAALNQSSDDPEVRLEAATTYLKSLRSSDAINEDKANAFIASLRPLSLDRSLGAGFRSRVYLALSGLHGRLADRAGLGGIEDGQKFFSFLNSAMDLDPGNQEATLIHANAVVEIYQEGILKRNLAESMLRIDLVEQAQAARGRLKALKLTTDPVFSAVSEISESE